jgi:hypothetical protein
MPSSDWGRTDNQAYQPADAMKASLLDYSNKIVQGLDGTNSFPVEQHAGKRAAVPKRTDKKVLIGTKEKVVYLGARGGKYVRVNGKYITVSAAKKACKGKK